VSELEAEVRRLAGPLVAAFAEADPDYPRGCCVYACAALEPYLRLRLRGLDAGVRRVFGAYDGDTHWWLDVDGLIVDPTAGQFVGGEALRVLPPGDARREPYEEREVYLGSLTGQAKRVA
jgi:hypothetical protein